ncbi:hypothetical protein NLJ89_g8044 [Agrocybe chaxingu]|uniref:BTB domain-containing protein n=1 Tax=Agrocybe chaxingu TaxID=84603 RepID=A0A9W8K370_9AGAR|nr:hypothetical protein NLJ89_g8044 [Agrocybe chaxingu]
MPEASSNVKQVVTSQDYFIEGGDLHLLVSEVLFRIHSSFFVRDSLEFRDALRKTPEAGKPRPGSAESPILIKASTPSEFAKFLWVFYNEEYSVYEATADEWTGILKVAHHYKFPKIKNLAICKLNKSGLSVVQKIRIFELYEADQAHIVPLYASMCMRDEGPSDEEIELMGQKRFVTVFRARERLRALPSSGNTSPLPQGIEEGDVLKTISEFLGLASSSSANTASATPSSTNGNGANDRKSGPKTNGPDEPNGTNSSLPKARRGRI